MLSKLRDWLRALKDALGAVADFERDVNALQAATGDSRNVLFRRMVVSGLSAAALLEMWMGGVRWMRDGTEVSAVVRLTSQGGGVFARALWMAYAYECQRIAKEGGRDAE